MPSAVHSGVRVSCDRAIVLVPVNQKTLVLVEKVRATWFGGSAKSAAGRSTGTSVIWLPVSASNTTMRPGFGIATATSLSVTPTTCAFLPPVRTLANTLGSSDLSGFGLITETRSVPSSGQRSIIANLPDDTATDPYVQPTRGCLFGFTIARRLPYSSDFTRSSRR